MNVGLMISALLQFAAMVVLGPLGVIVLTLGILGRRRLTRVGCAACRAALPRERAIARDRCPTCNAELADDKAIRAVRTGAGRTRIVGGLAILALAFAAGFGGAALQRRSMMAAFGPFGMNTPTAPLVRGAYSKNSPFTIEADEIGRRLGLGTARAEDVRRELLAILATGGVGRGPGADRMLALSMSDGVVDPTLASSLLGSAASMPTLDASALEGTPPRVVVRPPQAMRSPDDPVRVVYLVRAVRADGTPVADLAPFGLSPWQPKPIVVPKGTTRVEADVDLLLLSAFDAERIAQPSGHLRPLEWWPEPLATSRVTLSTAPPSP
jgi:hypothetical protein